MHLLPLITRELNVAARRRSTFWLRLVCGGGTMALAVWSILVWGSTASFSGATLFFIMCGIADVAMVFTGFTLALDAISRERREGTLQLLFLTDLSARDIVLGKFVASGAVPVLTLLSIFPSIAVCQLLGGLSQSQLWLCMLSLIATLLFSTSATLLISTIGRERTTVALGSVLLLIVTNPLVLLYLAATHQPRRFWFNLAGYGFIGVAFLAAAVLVLHRTWRDAPKTNEGKSRLVRHAENGRASLDQSAIAWMLLRRSQARPGVRWSIGVILAVSAVLISMEIVGRGQVMAALILLFAVHLGILITMLARTAYAFSNSQQDGSFELLMSTPLTNEDIFAGFARFLQLHSSKLLVGITLYDGFLSAVLWANSPRQLAAFPITMGIILWITFYGVRWLGVYRSLMVSRPFLSALATFWRISFFPIILSALFLWAPRTNYDKVCVFWVVSTGFLTLFFGNDARRVLIERGRELLLRPSSEKPPHIESEWSFINWEEIEPTQPSLETAQPVG